MWLEETISPSTSSSGCTTVSKRPSARSSRGRPAPGGRSGSSRRPTPARRAERADEHVVDELVGACARRTPRRRGSRSSPARPARRSARPCARASVSSLRRVLGRDHRDRVGVEGEHAVGAAITSRWPRCTPSKVPTATLRARPRSTSGRRVTFTGAKPIRAAGERAPRIARAPRARAPISGRLATAAPRGGGGDGVLDVEGADRRAPQLQAVGVAEVGDQRAHIGARSAFDLRSAARGGSPGPSPCGAPELLEAVDRDDPLGHLEAPRRGGRAGRRARRRSSPPSAPAGAGAPRRRAAAGGSGGIRPVSVISPSVSPVLDSAPRRATVS